MFSLIPSGIPAFTAPRPAPEDGREDQKRARQKEGHHELEADRYVIDHAVSPLAAVAPGLRRRPGHFVIFFTNTGQIERGMA